MAKVSPIPFPIGGVAESDAYGQQPKLTTPSARNVRGYDPRTGRLRGAQRAGHSKYLSRRVRSTNPVQELIQVTAFASETQYEDLTDEADFTVTTADLSSIAGGHIRGVAVDSEGYIYACGVEDTGDNKSVWKLAPDLTEVWSVNIGSDANGIAVYETNDGGVQYIAVAGDDSGVGGAAVWRISAAGSIEHSTRLPGNVNGNGVTINRLGQIVVAHDRGGSPVRSVTCYDAELSASQIYRGDTSQNAYGVAKCANDDVIVVGVRDSGNGRSVWRLRPTTGGGAVGLNSYYDTGDDTYGCIEDDAGFIVAVGDRSATWTGNNATNKSVWRLADDDSQWPQYALTVDVAMNTTTDAKCVAVDPDLNIYVGAVPTAGNVSIWKFDHSDGSTIWSYDSDDGPEDIDSTKLGIAVFTGTGKRDVYVVGERDSATTAMARLQTVNESTVVTLPRRIKNFACAGGSIRKYLPNQGTVVPLSGGDDVMLTGIGEVMSARLGRKAYFVDGFKYRVLDSVDETVTAWTVTAGTSLPGDDGNENDASANDGDVDDGGGSRLIEAWRGRIVLSGVRGDDHNVYFLKVGDPTDANYSASPTTETMAVALNAAPFGDIGDKVTALIAYNDDLLIIGCDHSIHRMTGDPAAGGRVDLVSDVVGIAWGRAWCKDEKGWVYFLGTDGQVYQMAPGSIPDQLTIKRLDQRLYDINLNTHRVQLVWDHEGQTLHVYITPYTAAATVDLAWDRRSDAWWLDNFASTDHQPTAVYTNDGDNPNDRVTLLGCRDGFIRKIDTTAKDDDGTAINSYVYFGPIVGPAVEAKHIAAQVTLGETSDAATHTIHVGDTAEAALSASASQSTTVAAGLNDWFRGRARGRAIFHKLASNAIDTAWSFERLDVAMERGGLVRTR